MTAVADAALPCARCAGNVPERARFCPACGAAVDDSAVVLDVDGGGDQGPSVSSRYGIGAERRSASSQPVGDSRGGSAGVALAITLVLGLTTWLVLRTPVTTLDGLSEALTPNAEANVGQQGLSGSTTVVDFQPVELDNGGPVLGSVMGVDLYVSRGSGLGRINLDTGETARFTVEGRPLAVYGTELLLLSNQRILAVDLSDPEGPSRLVYDLPVNSSADASPALIDGERLKIQHSDFSDAGVNSTVTVVDLESDQGETIAIGPMMSATFGMVWAPGAGSFDYVDGEFIKVFDGLVHSTGNEHGIGYRCEEPGTCGSHLFDRRTGELVDNVNLPSVDQRWQLGFVAGSDRLVAVSDELTGTRLYDVVNSTFLPGGLFPAGSGGPPDDQSSVATWDDRLVAVGSGSTVRIQDVSSEGVGWVLPLHQMQGAPIGSAERLFFVAR